jgi:hypothetical protein
MELRGRNYRLNYLCITFKLSMNEFNELITWSGRSKFRYSGSVKSGVKILYGSYNKYIFTLTSDDFVRLLDHFAGRKVRLNTSRTAPLPGSVGDWIRSNITKTAITSYLGPILISEGYARKDNADIIFRQK